MFYYFNGEVTLLESNLAVIDYTKCVSCGLCATACPRHIIRDVLDHETVEQFKAKLARATELHRRELAAAKLEAQRKAAEEAARQSQEAEEQKSAPVS